MLSGTGQLFPCPYPDNGLKERAGCVVLGDMIDAHLESWLTGTPSAGITPAELVVVTSADAPQDVGLAIERALMADPITERAGRPPSVRVLRSMSHGAVPQSADEFTGGFHPGADLAFGDGLEMSVRHYGVADFESLDIPTVLAICDDDDFSAYLRDADAAWRRGTFAGYATHPAAVIANLAGLGGSAEAAGPLHRLYVDDDGVARTSPWGRGLGTYDEGIAVLTERWRRWNAASTRPDASCLEAALPEADRTDALAERPYISRYATVLQTIRWARATGRTARQVSGFGGRLSDRAPQAAVVDPVDAPVLARFGAIIRAIDPLGATQVDLSAEQLLAIETVLGGLPASEVPGAAAACQFLAAHGVARTWCLSQRESVLTAA